MSKIEEIKHLLEVSRQMKVDKTWPITEDEVVEFISSSFEFGFVCGALWQKEQDQETIELAEDHAMLAGMEKIREKMKKNVVLETKVMKDNDGDGIDTPYEEWLTLENTEIPFIPDNIGLKDGDEVKVIVIKEN